MRPWFRFPGQASYTQGFAVITVGTDGTDGIDGKIAWSRKGSTKTYVYFTHDVLKSNTVVIPAK